MNEKKSLIKRLKEISIIKKGRVVETIEENKQGYKPLIDTNYLREKTNKIVYANNGLLVKKGDVLILWDGANAGEIFYSPAEGFLGSTLGVIRTSINKKFLFYYLKALERDIRSKTIGMGIPHVNTSMLKEYKILLPSEKQQKNISKFIQYEIDFLLSKVKRYNKKIELLKEYKEALIYETVTKGLDKKSNILWKAKRLKDIIYLNKGKAVETVLEQNNGYLPLIDTNYLRNRKDNIVYSKNGLYVKKNEVLVLWDGANSGEMFYNTNDGFLGSTFGVMKLKSKVTNSKFLFYYLKAFEKDIRKDIVGMGIPHVNGTKLKQRLIYIPPNNEQNEIVNFLDTKTKEIDSEVERLSKKAKLIEELKESIIYECVTGKLNIEVEGEKYQKIIESI